MLQVIISNFGVRCMLYFHSLKLYFHSLKVSCLYVGGHILLVIWSWFHGRLCLFIVLEMLIRIVKVDQWLVHSWEIVWMCLIDMLDKK